MSETRTFSKLKGRENYDLWKVSAKSYLVIKGFWSCISKEPTESKTDEMEKDLKALSELTLLLDESIYSYISNAVTAKQAWSNLEKSFEDSGLSRKVDLLKLLVKLSLEDCDSVEEYVSQMVSTCLKVGKAGLKIDDEILASLMLAGLPDEYKPLVMAIENSSTKLTSDAVKTLLLQETRFKTYNNASGGSAYLSKPKNPGKFKYRCRTCGEIGHMAKDCLEKHEGGGCHLTRDCLDKQGNGWKNDRNRENGGRNRENSGWNNGTGFIVTANNRAF